MKTHSCRSYYSRLLYRDRFVLTGTILMILSALVLIARELIRNRILLAEIDIIMSPLFIQEKFLTYVPVVMAGMMLISYEYSSLFKRKKLAESVEAIEKGYERNLAYTFYTLLKLVVFVFAFFTVLLLFFTRDFAFTYPKFLLYLLKSQFIYYFLLPLLSVVIGLVASFSRNRLTAYLVILIFFILSTNFGYGLLLSYTSFLGPLAAHVIGLFDLCPKGLSWEPQDGYGYPAENYIIIQMLFWLCLFICLILLHIFIKKKTIGRAAATIIGLIFTVALFFIHISPASIVNMKDYGIYDSGTQDSLYYMENMQIEKQTGTEISAYDLHFSVDRLLRADVSFNYRHDIKEPFYLTLYHGFKVTSIQDESGRPLNFRQELDAIEILDPVPETGQLRMIYHGFGAKYFSNDQGIFLPANFAYYPRPGLQAIYDNEQGGFKPLFSPQPVSFAVTVDYRDQVYCNLPASGKNEFSGPAHGISLFSGLYQEEDFDGVRVLYPYFGTVFGNRRDDFIANIQPLLPSEPLLQDIKFIVYMPNMNFPSPYESMVLLPDHLMISDSAFMLTERLQIYQFLSQKYDMSFMLTVLEDKPDLFWAKVDYKIEEIEEMPEFEDFFKQDNYYRFGMVLEQAEVSQDEIVNICKSYINNDRDKRTVDEFLTDLENKYLKDSK